MIVVIGITGFTGRMGTSIAEVVENHPSACLGGGIARAQTLPPTKENSPYILTDDPSVLFPKCDVIVDFSHASVAPQYAELAANLGKPFLTGTTGLDKAALDKLREAAKKIPLLHASNTSLSLIVARRVVKLAAALLKDHDFDVSILDKHHKWKKDSPSGTALALGEAVAAGNEGKKIAAYASLRTGAIVGEHEVMFSGPGEALSIHHSVTDRRVFSRGAVHGALWLVNQKPGYYLMDDVLDV